MVRAMVIALLIVGAGCGDDTNATTFDMTVSSGDLSTGGNHSCGVDDISVSCPSVSGAVRCFICDYTALMNGRGRCASPCMLAAPSCPTGQTCRELGGGDGGATGGFAVEGTGCSGYGFCR